MSSEFSRSVTKRDVALNRAARLAADTIWRARSEVFRSFPWRTGIICKETSLQAQFSFGVLPEYSPAGPRIASVARRADENQAIAMREDDGRGAQLVRLYDVRVHGIDLPRSSEAGDVRDLFMAAQHLPRTKNLGGANDQFLRLALFDFVANVVLPPIPPPRIETATLNLQPMTGNTLELYTEVCSSWQEKLHDTLQLAESISTGNARLAQKRERAARTRAEEEEEGSDTAESEEAKRLRHLDPLGFRPWAADAINSASARLQGIAEYDVAVDLGATVANIAMAAHALDYLFQVHRPYNVGMPSFESFKYALVPIGPLDDGANLLWKHFLSKFEGGHGEVLAMQPLLLAVLISPILLCLGEKLYEGDHWRVGHMLAISQRVRMNRASPALVSLNAQLSKAIVDIAFHRSTPFPTVLAALANCWKDYQMLTVADRDFLTIASSSLSASRDLLVSSNSSEGMATPSATQSTSATESTAASPHSIDDNPGLSNVEDAEVAPLKEHEPGPSTTPGESQDPNDEQQEQPQDMDVDVDDAEDQPQPHRLNGELSAAQSIQATSPSVHSTGEHTPSPSALSALSPLSLPAEPASPPKPHSPTHDSDGVTDRDHSRSARSNSRTSEPDVEQPKEPSFWANGDKRKHGRITRGSSGALPKPKTPKPGAAPQAPKAKGRGRNRGGASKERSKSASNKKRKRPATEDEDDGLLVNSEAMQTGSDDGFEIMSSAEVAAYLKSLGLLPERRVKEEEVERDWLQQTYVQDDFEIPSNEFDLDLLEPKEGVEKVFTTVKAAGGDPQSLEEVQVQLPLRDREVIQRLLGDISESHEKIHRETAQTCPPWVKIFTPESWKECWRVDEDGRRGSPFHDAMNNRMCIWYQGDEENSFLRDEWDWTVKHLSRFSPGSQGIQVQDLELDPEGTTTTGSRWIGLKDFIDAGENGYSLNMLDSPLSWSSDVVPQWREYDSSYEAVSVRKKQHVMTGSFRDIEEENVNDRSLANTLRESSNWGIFSHAGSLTLPHVDTGGVCTTVMVAHGKKLWGIQDTRRNSTHLDVRHNKFARKYDMYQANTNILSWGFIVLQKHHVLFMPGSTIHCAATLTPSIIEGQHFISEANIADAFCAFATTALDGGLTNTSHPEFLSYFQAFVTLFTVRDRDSLLHDLERASSGAEPFAVRTLEMVVVSILAVVFNRALSALTLDQDRMLRGTYTLDRFNGRDLWANMARHGYILVSGKEPADFMKALRTHAPEDYRTNRHTLAGLTPVLLFFGRNIIDMSTAVPEKFRTSPWVKEDRIVREQVEQDIADALYWPRSVVSNLLKATKVPKSTPLLPEMRWIAYTDSGSAKNTQAAALLWPGKMKESPSSVASPPPELTELDGRSKSVFVGGRQRDGRPTSSSKRARTMDV